LLIAGTYLAGTNPRRVRRALAAVFGTAIDKPDGAEGEIRPGCRSLAEELSIRWILDSTVMRVRLAQGGIDFARGGARGA
jgi:putative transposase